MKRIILTLILAVCAFSAFAQSLLVNTLQPVEQKHCSADPSQTRIGGREYDNSLIQEKMKT